MEGLDVVGKEISLPVNEEEVEKPNEQDWNQLLKQHSSLYSKSSEVCFVDFVLRNRVMRVARENFHSSYCLYLFFEHLRVPGIIIATQNTENLRQTLPSRAYVLLWGDAIFRSTPSGIVNGGSQ